MGTTSNILTLLKFNCSKQNTQMLEYDKFSDYVHLYAQHHVDENPELVNYCGTNYRETLDTEINNLVTEHQVVLGNVRNKDVIFVVSFYIEKFTELYTQIETNIAIPFPSINDLSKNVPREILSKKAASEMICSRLDKEELNDKTLYSLFFSKEIPDLIFPSSCKMATVVNLSLKKIQAHLQKGEHHDYFLRKLTVSNPGKEVSIKTFFSGFCANPQNSLESLRETGDSFYYWSQLCHFIKQDYKKLKDFTAEDITILQSIAVIEIATSYYKSKAAERIQVEAAFNQLDIQMHNPPYYFNMEDVLKLKDKNGIPLLGQYKEEQLKEYLKEKCRDSEGNQLPDLLIFRLKDESGYYIYKDRVVPLVIKLANEVRGPVRDALMKEWFGVLKDYDLLPEMKDNSAFERVLEQEVSAIEPVLSALLDSSFIHVVALENPVPGGLTLFRNDALIPYSELLMINRQELLSDAKFHLPFWYTLPIISSLFKFLFGKSKSKKNKRPRDSVALKIQEEKKQTEKETFHKRDEEDSIDRKNKRRRELRSRAIELEKEFVPENSTLERELKSYMSEWNDRLDKQNYENLGDDVNALIRDYFRKILRTMPSDTFTSDRVRLLAETLVATPAMMKLKNHPALTRYVELYILQIVKGLKATNT